MYYGPEFISTALRKWAAKHSVELDFIFSLGKGNWPEVMLKLANGSHATISLYGGHLLHWVDAKSRDIFYLSENSLYSEGKAIRGGIPVIFPWFGKVAGMSQSHGFARTMFWNFESCAVVDDKPSVTLSLTQNEQTLSQWSHSFKLELTYTLSDSLLSEVKIKNTSKQNFTAQFALHSYCTTQSIHNVQVRGLESCEFVDKARDNLARGRETSKALKFMGLVDRIYLAVKSPITIHGVGNYVLNLSGDMPDRVTWNPGKVEGAKIADLPPGGFERFVCIEAGAVENKISLAPGATWTAKQLIALER